MNRRGFLRAFIGCAAVVSVAPSVLLEVAPKPSVIIDIDAIAQKYLCPFIADELLRPSPWYEMLKKRAS